MEVVVVIHEPDTGRPGASGPYPSWRRSPIVGPFPGGVLPPEPEAPYPLDDVFAGEELEG